MKKLIYLVLILSIFLYCAPKQGEVEKIIEDGVEVIVNHLEPYKIKGEANSLTLEEEFIIDTEDDEIAEQGLTDIWAVNVDSEENIYIWESPTTRGALIFKFDSNGYFQKSFLKRGQGPGEV